MGLILCKFCNDKIYNARVMFVARSIFLLDEILSRSLNKAQVVADFESIH